MSTTLFEHVRSVSIIDVHIESTEENTVGISTNPFVLDVSADMTGANIGDSSEGAIDWQYVVEESALAGIILVIGMSAIVVYAVTTRVVYPAVSRRVVDLGNKLDAFAASFSKKKKKSKKKKSKRTKSSGDMTDTSDSEYESDVEVSVETVPIMEKKSEREAKMCGGNNTSISLKDIKNIVESVSVGKAVGCDHLWTLFIVWT